MKKDDILINQIIEEGLLSRASARAKAMGGAVKQAAGDVATAFSGEKPASNAGWKGKYTEGKQEQILKSISKNIINDLTKLKVVPDGSTLNPTDLQKTLTQYISQYTGLGKDQQQTQTSSTPPTSTSSGATTPQTQQSSTTSQTSTTPSTTPTTDTSQTQSTQQNTSTASTSTPSTAATPQTQTPTSASTSSSTPASTSSSTPESTEPEAPSEPIPLGSTITAKNGKSYRYTSPDEIGETTSKGNITNPFGEKGSSHIRPEIAKWYELSKSGKSAYDSIDDENIQKAITNAWQKQNASQQQQQKQASVPQFESFKNYFWK